MLTPERATDILGRSKGGRWRRSPSRYLGYFEDALHLLEVRGWTQKAYARNKRGDWLPSGKARSATSFCALGALERATPEYKDFEPCRQLLAHAVGTDIAVINDAPDKAAAKARVLAAYGSVITMLKALNDK